MRVAVTQAQCCPWPLLARRFYQSRADAKLAYLLPLTVGIQIAGVRLINLQARWALAAITGRTTWPRTLRVPSQLRKRICSDLGWPCLWSQAKISAITLHQKCKQDCQVFAHARLCAATHMAPGGWLSAAQRLTHQHNISDWEPPHSTVRAQKRSLQRYRKETVTPALMAKSLPPDSPSLPWAWIAMNAGHSFSHQAFEHWLQIRLLGQPFPARTCPWCQPAVPMTETHLHLRCATFSYRCFMAGILPTDAFSFPQTAEKFCAAVNTLEPTGHTTDNT